MNVSGDVPEEENRHVSNVLERCRPSRDSPPVADPSRLLDTCRRQDKGQWRPKPGVPQSFAASTLKRELRSIRPTPA